MPTRSNRAGPGKRSGQKKLRQKTGVFQESYTPNNRRVKIGAPRGPPAAQRVRMTYDTNFTMAGSNVVVARYNPNGTFNLTPSSTNQATLFSSMALLYNFNRLISYKYRHEISSQETFPIRAIVMNLNQDPTSTARTDTWASQPMSTAKEVTSVNGGNPTVLEGSFTMTQVVGSREVMYDKDYRGDFLTNPLDVIWNILVLDGGPNTLPNGAKVNTTLELNVEWYDRCLNILEEDMLKIHPDVTEESYLQFIKKPNHETTNQQRERLNMSRAMRNYLDLSKDRRITELEAKIRRIQMAS